MKKFAMILALAFCCYAQNNTRSVAGTVWDKVFYFQSIETIPDTIGYQVVEGSLKLDPDSSRVYKLKNPSAISLFILDQLGYDLFVLSRWQSITRLALKVRDKNMPDRFAQQGIMTDVLWEPVDRIERITQEQPKKAVVRIHFPNGGYLEMDEKEKPSSSARQVFGTAGLVVRYRTGGSTLPDEAQTQTVYRDVFSVYFVTDKAKTSKQVVAEIEKEMDRLKLDMSYRVPEWGPMTNGRTQESIIRVVMQNLDGLRDSYNERRKEKPGLKGKITVRFSIDPTGNVVEAKVIGSTMDDPALEKAITSQVLGWQFGPVDRPGLAVVEYPFAFSP